MTQLQALVTQTQSDGILLSQYIWLKIVERQAASDVSKLEYYGSPITIEAFKELSEDDKRECEILGTIPGCVIRSGHTVRYANVQKMYEDTRWFLIAPDDMTLVEGCPVEFLLLPYDQQWIPLIP